jgi:hypothetical protein
MQARMAWIATLHPSKVPVAVAATGPRTIFVGVRHAEHVNFTVGPIPAGYLGRWERRGARQRVAAMECPSELS